jgi:hypothetical protein
MEQVFRQNLREITKIWRTSHNHPHIIRNTMDDTQRLCNGRQSFILRQLIQSLEGSLCFVFPPQILHEFLCDTLSINNVYLTAHLLNRPCLICFVAKASTESNSTIILTMRSVII